MSSSEATRPLRMAEKRKPAKATVPKTVRINGRNSCVVVSGSIESVIPRTDKETWHEFIEQEEDEVLAALEACDEDELEALKEEIEKKLGTAERVRSALASLYLGREWGLQFRGWFYINGEDRYVFTGFKRDDDPSAKISKVYLHRKMTKQNMAEVWYQSKQFFTPDGRFMYAYTRFLAWIGEAGGPLATDIQDQRVSNKLFFFGLLAFVRNFLGYNEDEIPLTDFPDWWIRLSGRGNTTEKKSCSPEITSSKPTMQTRLAAKINKEKDLEENLGCCDDEEEDHEEDQEEDEEDGEALGLATATKKRRIAAESDDEGDIGEDEEEGPSGGAKVTPDSSKGGSRFLNNERLLKAAQQIQHDWEQEKNALKEQASASGRKDKSPEEALKDAQERWGGVCLP